ncbi:hypothetical protein TNCT_551761 [Trichonephila clavata]|uniref:Uncharacterized protein n=1 Tax=Trichonephila clavata TaxID=2740835 RepID=A0A8X6L6Y6_TRICU|nr:hypothetical protein TNCT_551761 [Trichonephila clavata]
MLSSVSPPPSSPVQKKTNRYAAGTTFLRRTPGLTLVCAEDSHGFSLDFRFRTRNTGEGYLEKRPLARCGPTPRSPVQEQQQKKRELVRSCTGDTFTKGVSNGSKKESMNQKG